MGTKLYVGNLQYTASEEDVRALFSQLGEVLSVKIISDAITGRARGFGFVEMSNQELAEKAISTFNGKEFMERTLVVNEARPLERSSSKGGFSRSRERDFDSGSGSGFGGRRNDRRR